MKIQNLQTRFGATLSLVKDGEYSNTKLNASQQKELVRAIQNHPLFKLLPDSVDVKVHPGGDTELGFDGYLLPVQPSVQVSMAQSKTRKASQTEFKPRFVSFLGNKPKPVAEIADAIVNKAASIFRKQMTDNDFAEVLNRTKLFQKLNIKGVPEYQPREYQFSGYAGAGAWIGDETWLTLSDTQEKQNLATYTLNRGTGFFGSLQNDVNNALWDIGKLLVRCNPEKTQMNKLIAKDLGINVEEEQQDVLRR